MAPEGERELVTGIWNVELDVYSFVTTAPNSATASINHERSPVILDSDEARDVWINGSPDEARVLIGPLDGDRLRVVQASAEKRDLGGELVIAAPAPRTDLFS